MVLRWYQGAVCDFLCQCETGRGSSLSQCVCVLLWLIILAFVSHQEISLELCLKKNKEINKRNKSLALHLIGSNYWSDFKPNLLTILVWKLVLQLQPKLRDRDGCISFFLFWPWRCLSFFLFATGMLVHAHTRCTNRDRIRRIQC